MRTSMKVAIPIILLTGAASFWAAAGQPTNAAGRLDDMERPAPEYTGPRFEPNYNFPAQPPAAEARPWEAINFRNDAGAYMEALLAYVLEGQDTTRWDVAANPVRQWYHMPWMGPGGQGREYISGLTSERRSRPGELGPRQTRCRQNWAVGFYNPVGGHVLGRLWAPVASGASMQPDLSALPFPAGTVVAKALYTEATETEVDLLVGAPTIQARIVEDATPNDADCPDTDAGNRPAPRTATTLRLLQLDVAVRDPDADSETGWVFGTFIYDGRLPGTDPWRKLRPVGLMWGNDERLSDQAAANGERPTQSIVLSDFGIGRPFGRGRRMNGPVDNPDSACLSCHMTAQYPSPAGMSPPRNAQWAVASCWFRNLSQNTPFGLPPRGTTACGTQAPRQVGLDYSLQLAVGVRNISIAEQNARRGGIEIFGVTLFGRRALEPDDTVTIDGVTSVPISRDEADYQR